MRKTTSERFRATRLLLGLMVVSAVLAGVQSADATQSPAGCLNNDFVLNIGQSATAVHVGDTITYNISTGNPQDAQNLGCDVTNVTVTGIRPNGTTVTLQTGGNYPIGTAVSVLGTFTYVVNAADRNAAGVVVASGHAVGILNDNPFQDDPLDISKQVSAFVSIPSIDVTKQCVNATGPGQPITFSGTVTNTGNVELLNVTCTDDKAGAVTVPATLAIGASANYTGSYVPSTSPSTDTVTCTGTDALGGATTDSASATCIIQCSPSVSVTKQCVDGQPITYSGTVTNTGNASLACTLSDSFTGGGTDTPTPSSANLAPGASVSYSGSYTATTSPSTDTVTATCVVEAACGGGTVSANASATCAVPVVEEICRTPGFWATHAGTEKLRSNNITQAVITAAGGTLHICGEDITNTTLNSASSAEEALCVPVQGNQNLQLARQLTAAALNCVISGGGADCAGASIAGLFNDCNSLCPGDLTDPAAKADVTACIGLLDCFNNGKLVANGVCTSASTGCHDRALVNASLGLFFDPPGPAGSEKECNDANKTACTIIPPGEAQCTLP